MHTPHRASLRPLALGLPLVLALIAGCATAQPAPPWRDGRSIGIEARDSAGSADLGLPVYPGAAPRPDQPKESSGVTFAVWGQTSGLKIVAAKYLSPDPVDQVAAFYRRAFGPAADVLDCSTARPRSQDDPKVLSCGPSEVGTRTYKSGTPGRHRSVTLSQRPQGTAIDLVRVETGD